MSVLVASGLTKRFGEGSAAVAAVASVDLSIDAGEVMLLLGPSGSVKTTLLSMLGGLLRPSAASVEIAGRTLAADPSALPRLRPGAIGFVFQSFNLLPSLTAPTNVALPLASDGRARPDRQGSCGRAAGGVRSRQPARCQPEDAQRGREAAREPGPVPWPATLQSSSPTNRPPASTRPNGREAIEILRSSTHRGRRACLVVIHDVRLIDYGDRILRIEDGRLVES